MRIIIKYHFVISQEPKRRHVQSHFLYRGVNRRQNTFIWPSFWSIITIYEPNFGFLTNSHHRHFLPSTNFMVLVMADVVTNIWNVYVFNLRTIHWYSPTVLENQ